MAAPRTPEVKFAEGEKLLCYHGPLLYEAKCLKSRPVPEKARLEKELAEGTLEYLVHYQGWKKKWDEWLLETRILRISSDSLALKERLLASHVKSQKETKKTDNKASTKARKASSRNASPSRGNSSGCGDKSPSSAPVGVREEGSTAEAKSANTSSSSSPVAGPSRETSTSSASKRKKLKPANLQNVAPDSNSTSQPEGNPVTVNVEIPDDLKFVLVSDWDLLMHKKSLLVLPADMSVESILEDYKASSNALAKGELSENTIAEVVDGIKDFFDAFCGKYLLYNVERTQYEKFFKSTESTDQRDEQNNRRPSQVYGSAHLLRLMVKIGGLLSKFQIGKTDEENPNQLIEATLIDLLNYLEENRSNLFLSKNYSALESSD